MLFLNALDLSSVGPVDGHDLRYRTDDNPLRLVCMLEWTWSMGHLFRDVLLNI